MVFPILGGNSAVGGYTIDNSLRFNDNDSASLSRTPSSAGNRKTWTFSVWVKRANIDSLQTFFGAGNDSTDTIIKLNSNNTFEISRYSGGYTNQVQSTQLFRDVSAWYHLVGAVDTTQATASNRVKMYVNGSQITDFGISSYPSLNFEYELNSTSYTTRIGRHAGGQYFDGYLAEFNFIDGQALSPTDFGEFDTDSGIWKPKQFSGSYGTNGFYLDFENSGSLGADQSGNGNNFTPTNLASTDQTTDTPTNNFATMNALWRNASAHSNTYSEGNLKINLNSGGGNSYSTMAVSSGKWYFEFETLSNFQCQFEGRTTDNFGNYSAGAGNTTFTWYYSGDIKVNNTSTGVSQAYGHQANNTSETKEICGVAVDLDNNKVYFHRLGTYVNSANPSTGTNGISITNAEYIFGFSNDSGTTRNVANFNYGNPPFSISSGNSDGNGYGNFEYSVPSGYLALCTQNLATALSPTIDDGSLYQNQVLYTGNHPTGQSITGVGFQPDFTWIKCRSHALHHRLFDSSRGALKNLLSSATNAEATTAGSLTSFDSDGFTLGSDDNVNYNARTFVAWNWKANAGTTSSNTDGSITSTVQANTTAGFSIVTYTGTGATATFGHGLGAVPKMVIIKDRDALKNWTVYHNKTFNNRSTFLNLTDGQTAPTDHWQYTTPTSSIVYIGDYSHINTSGNDYVAYCFAEIEGYSKFSSWEGNNSNDGAFVYTGFKPSFILLKNIDYNGTGWGMFDSKRSPYNPLDTYLLANSSATDSGGTDRVDFLSNGFKWRNNALAWNGNYTYIYMAFAENPFVSSSGVPVTAR